MAKKVTLKYSRERAGEPILSSVVRKVEAPINILHADLTERGGQFLILVEGSDAEVQEVMDLFGKYGVEAEEIKKFIDLKEEECIDCGACVSLCPTKALVLADDFSLKVDDDRCIYCKACIPSCPTRALEIEEF